MKTINKAQVRALRTAAGKAFGVCDCAVASTASTGSATGLCAYHDWLAAEFDGVTSTLDLSFEQAKEAISFLALKQGYVSSSHTSSKYSGQGRKGLPGRNLTSPQGYKISILAELLEWDERRVRWFIKRQTGKLCSVEMLRGYEATKMIVGMQKILAHGDKELYRTLNNISPFDPESGLGKAVIKVFKRGLHHGKTSEEIEGEGQVCVE